MIYALTFCKEKKKNICYCIKKSKCDIFDIILWKFLVNGLFVHVKRRCQLGSEMIRVWCLWFLRSEQ